MKTYVLTLSKYFPNNHNKSGYPTHFQESFSLGTKCKDCSIEQDLSGINICQCNSCVRACQLPKIHTIRANYPLWLERFKEIESGNAVLSIRQWLGKPYRSKQVEIALLTAQDGIGIQRIQFHKDREGVYSLKFFDIEGKDYNAVKLANNDGLTFEDWKEWFRTYNLSDPLAIIHFTQFRY